eukprot:11948811-Alexandrium_andersonii.AAC.1
MGSFHGGSGARITHGRHGMRLRRPFRLVFGLRLLQLQCPFLAASPGCGLALVPRGRVRGYPGEYGCAARR